MEGRCPRCGAALPRSRLLDGPLAEVATLAQRGQLIDAIKRYRELTGQGLKESKDAVEQIAQGFEPRLPPGALENRSGAAALTPEQVNEIERLILAGEKIEAIKRHRQFTGSGLKEAKDAVDDIDTRLRPADSLPFPGSARPPPAARSLFTVSFLAWFIVALVAGLIILALVRRA